MRRVFTGDNVTFEGKSYTVRDVTLYPKPVQRPHPPILIGGMGPKVILPLVARHADIWNFFAPDDPAQAKEIAGRPAKEVQSRIRALAAVGARHFVVSLPAPYDLAMLRGFAKDVMPALRNGRA